jgi:hypothetical protein
VAGSAARLSRLAGGPRRPPPSLDQHTRRSHRSRRSPPLAWLDQRATCERVDLAKLGGASMSCGPLVAGDLVGKLQLLEQPEDALGALFSRLWYDDALACLDRGTSGAEAGCCLAARGGLSRYRRHEPTAQQATDAGAGAGACASSSR